MLARNIDALMRAKHTIILNLDIHSWPLYSHNLHTNRTVVEKNYVANLYILGKVRERDIDDVMCSIHFWTAEYSNYIACLIFYWGFNIRSSHFWTFCVYKNTNMR